MLEPAVEMAFLSPHNLCPQNLQYGAEVNGFYVSPIFSIGKLWQIRSVLIDNTTWRIFPFIVNGGGAKWNLPIISDSVVKYCGIDRSLVVDRPHLDRFFMPVPLGNITFPLVTPPPPLLSIEIYVSGTGN
jgi:hypothetical protein